MTESSAELFRNIKGIIFDFDGTLYDIGRIAFYLIAAYPPDMFRIRNERLIRKEFVGCDYSSPEEYYRAFFAALGKTCRRPPEQMRSWYFERYMPRMIRVLKKHYKPRPGVKELLGHLKTKIAIYSDYPCLKERTEALGLFTAPRISLYGPEYFGAQKPAPRPFLHIADDLGITPAETLVIGDREDTDGLGALRAGMRFFYLETSRKSHTQEFAGTWVYLNKLLIEKFAN